MEGPRIGAAAAVMFVAAVTLAVVVIVRLVLAA